MTNWIKYCLINCGKFTGSPNLWIIQLMLANTNIPDMKWPLKRLFPPLRPSFHPFNGLKPLSFSILANGWDPLGILHHFNPFFCRFMQLKAQQLLVIFFCCLTPLVNNEKCCAFWPLAACAYLRWHCTKTRQWKWHVARLGSVQSQTRSVVPMVPTLSLIWNAVMFSEMSLCFLKWRCVF